MSLRLKFLLITLAVLVVPMITLGAYHHYRAQNIIKELIMEEHRAKVARQVADAQDHRAELTPPESILKKIGSDELGYRLLIDQDGLILAHADSAKIGADYFREQPELKARLETKESFEFQDVEDRQIRVWRKIADPSGDPGKYWVLISVIPEGELFAPYYRLRDVTYFLAVLALTVGGFAVWQITSIATRPLERLIEGVKALGRGDWEHRFAMRRHDEIGELADSFDLMVENLKRLTLAREKDRTALESMFKNASVGIVICGENGRIKRANRHAETIFGRPADSMIGLGIEDFVPPELRKRHALHREHFNRFPHPRAMGLGMNLRAVRGDGSEFPVEISLTSYEIDGAMEIVCFLSDISARKQAEEDLRALSEELSERVEERTRELSHAIQELQYINKALVVEMEQRKRAETDALRALDREKELGELKSRFVAMASHEFRTPLSGIMTSAALIGKYNELSDKDKRLKHVSSIQESVRSLTNILNDFLSLEKLEEGRVEYRPVDVDLRLFGEEIAREMQQLAKPGQRILFECRDETDTVSLDRQLLRNVLINLLSNAIKYSSRDVRLTVESSDGTVRLSVIDEGIGIPEADHANLFGTFFRAANVGAIQGTGLGLNIVKKYLDLMQGSIHFTSEENRGTTFVVQFPGKA